MSEAEKKRRLEYKQKRKKRMILQLIAILLVTLIALAMAFTYHQLNKIYYIDYTESGFASHDVVLKNNEFFEEDKLGSQYGYVSDIVDKIEASFKYNLDMNASAIQYEHTHYVDAKVQIKNRTSGAVLYQPVETLVDKISEKTDQSSLLIKESVSVDYHKYNDMAKKFINAYGLGDVVSTLIITMHVDVVGNCDDFQNESHKEYFTQLNIPLNTKVVEISSSASAPAGESNVLACKNDMNPTVFKVLAIVFGLIDAILIIVIIAFVFLTRNDDINYGIKIKRLLGSYRSYIQIITNDFNTEGYQLISVGSFKEMLGIRDTLQSPILMYENDDRTKTQFLIPTNTKLLYVFEIKVDDYDRIYANTNA